MRQATVKAEGISICFLKAELHQTQWPTPVKPTMVEAIGRRISLRAVGQKQDPTCKIIMNKSWGCRGPA
jgi:hypothetical protein